MYDERKLKAQIRTLNAGKVEKKNNKLCVTRVDKSQEVTTVAIFFKFTKFSKKITCTLHFKAGGFKDETMYL